MKMLDNLDKDRLHTRKGIFSRICACLAAFSISVLSFVVFVPTDNAEAQSNPRFDIYEDTYSGIFDGFSLTSLGMLEYGATYYGVISQVDRYSREVTYNSNTAYIHTTADMNIEETLWGSHNSIANRYYPSQYNDTSMHYLVQTLSTGDFAGNYYLYSYYCNSLKFYMQTPRIVYIDNNLRNTDKQMIYCAIPDNLIPANYNRDNFYYAYRMGFTYRDIDGNLQYYETGDYVKAKQSQVYDTAMYWNWASILNSINERALRNSNCYLFEDFYFETTCVYFSAEDLDNFNNITSSIDKYRFLFANQSAYDKNDTEYNAVIKPYYTQDYVCQQYLNIPLNTTTLQAQNIATMDTSNMWLQYAYNDNYGVWSMFHQFFNIELFPNFKLYYLITLGFAILCINLVYKFIVV